MARKVTSIYLVFDLEGEISSWFHGLKVAREYVKVQRFSREYSIVRFIRAKP